MFRTSLPFLSGHALGGTFLSQTGAPLRLRAPLLLFCEKRLLLCEKRLLLCGKRLSFGLFTFRSQGHRGYHHRSGMQRHQRSRLYQSRSRTVCGLQSRRLLRNLLQARLIARRGDDLRDGLVGLFRRWKLLGDIELDRDGVIQNLSDSIDILISLLLRPSVDGSGDIKLCLERRSITSECGRDDLIVLILEVDYRDILSRASIKMELHRGALNHVGWEAVQELSADFRTLLEVEASYRIAVLGKGLDHQLVCTSGVPRYSIPVCVADQVKRYGFCVL